MNIYQRLDQRIKSASTCETIRWYDLLDKGSASRLESLAKSDNQSDPRREMAREIVYELFLSVFGQEKL